MVGHAILVTGCNATGKTTATQAALATWVADGRLRTVYADSSDRHSFKGSQVDIEALLASILAEPTELVVVEGTTRIARAFGRTIRGSLREFECYGTLVDGPTMRAMLETRCAKLGKRFRGEFWTVERCALEQRDYHTVNKNQLGGAMQWYPVGADYRGAVVLQAWLMARAQEILGAPQAQETPAPGRLF